MLAKLFNTAVCRILKDTSLYLDVVSGGELYTAIKASFPMEKIFFHGNNKSMDELVLAIESGVGRIVVDNIQELELLNRICIEKNTRADILFRITPGVGAHTHKYIQTGQEDSKFGIPIFLVEDVIERALKMKGVNVKGIHCHIGSQILDSRPYENVTEIMLSLIKKLNQNDNIIISELNLGGGFGISYSSETPPLNMDQLIAKLTNYIKLKTKEFNIPLPKIFIEPGRYITGNAGITLYEVGTIKEIANIRKYVSVNGGMTDNPRTALYGAKYKAYIANKMDIEDRETVSIAGRCCESGDMLIWDISLPPCESGDILAILDTGAYNYSMSSNYNRFPKPNGSFEGKQSEIITKGETYEDITRNDRIPSWL